MEEEIVNPFAQGASSQGQNNQSGELQSIQPAYRLHGKNYLKWAQLVRTVLKGKGKLSHLTGDGPAEEDPTFTAWDEEDSMIMAWLWNSMIPEISDTCMFLSTAKEIWDAIEETYSKAKDAAQVYDVKVKTVAAKQGNKSVTEYANQLKSLWMEWDHYRVIKTHCAADSAVLKEFIEQDRVYDFLVGLNPEFDQVRIQILGKPQVPSLNEVVAIVRSEESRRNLMLDTPSIESSAMITESHRGGGLAKVEKKGEMWCTYCNNPRHTREICWKLHGKPPNRGGKKGGLPGGVTRKNAQTYVAEKVEENKAESSSNSGLNSLNQEEIERMRAFLKSLEKPTGTCTLAYSGMLPISFGFNVSNIPPTSLWILDSGATDHMTPSSNYFSTYHPSPSNKKISTADGTLVTVAGIGDIQITPSIILKNVLHVPKLSTNLVSIQKLTKDLSCSVIFHSNHCVFQDKNSGRTIGHGREGNGLYYLEEPNQLVIAKNLPVCSLMSESLLTSKEKNLLFHCRLGHPSFGVIKIMFPSLFSDVKVETLHCEVCEIAKHKRVPFPLNNKRCTIPFHLVHTDVWGPSTIPSVFGARWFITFIDDCTRVTWLFLIKNKSEVSTVIPNFFSMIKNQFGANIKRIRSDNGKEFFNHVITPFCEKEGIIHESSFVQTPQQNGITERKNGHGIGEDARQRGGGRFWQRRGEQRRCHLRRYIHRLAPHDQQYQQYEAGKGRQ
jgi:hypothetical protein